MQLWTAFKEKKAQGLVKDAGSGFGGHGFKFDASEQERAKEKKQAEKAVCGWLLSVGLGFDWWAVEFIDGRAVLPIRHCEWPSHVW